MQQSSCAIFYTANHTCSTHQCWKPLQQFLESCLNVYSLYSVLQLHDTPSAVDLHVHVGVCIQLNELAIVDALHAQAAQFQSGSNVM